MNTNSPAYMLSLEIANEIVKEDKKKNKISKLDPISIAFLIFQIISFLYSIWKKNHATNDDIRKESRGIGLIGRFLVKQKFAKFISKNPQLTESYKEYGDIGFKKSFAKMTVMSDNDLDDISGSVEPIDWNLL